MSPYRGTRDGGASIFNAYVQGAQLKMARREQEAIEKLRAAKLGIEEAYLQVAQERRADEDEEHEQRMFDARLREKWAGEDRAAGRDPATLAGKEESRRAAGFAMDARSYEQGQTDRTRARQSENAMGEARTEAGVGNVYRIIKKYPELVPEAEIASRVMSKLTDPVARGVWAVESQNTLQKRADEIDLTRAEEAWNNAQNQGGLGGADGAPDEGLAAVREQARAGAALYKESGGKQGISGKQSMDLLTKTVQEKAKNDGIAQARQMNAEELRAAWLVKVPPAQREQAAGLINAYERPHPGGPTFDQVQGTLQEMISPKQAKDPNATRVQDQTTLFKALVEANPAFKENPEAAWKKAGEMLGGGQAQGGGGGDPQAEANALAAEMAAAGKSKEEIRAALKAKFGGK